MIHETRFRRLCWGFGTVTAWLFAAWIVSDTLRALVPLWSPLPWFDEWATVRLLGAWQSGEMTGAQVLFAQHNEHRILVPRLIFFADDLLLRGGGLLSLAAIVLVQAAHAALFAAVLVHARPPRAGRWALAALVVALMFSLRQVENFSSGFQVQFVGVFAGATLSFVLFGLAIARLRRAVPHRALLAASFGVVAVTSFTMANGLVAAFVLVAMGLAARLGRRIVLASAAWAALLALVYFQGYEPVAHHSRPLDSLHHPLGMLLYVAAYLGSLFATAHLALPAATGLAGLAAMCGAGLRCLRQRGSRPAALALVAVMVFAAAAAAVTASGRLSFGLGQALSSRYVAGSVTFWAAQAVYWWIDPPAWPSRGTGSALTRTAVLAAGLVVAAVLLRDQRWGKTPLVQQSFAQAEAADLLMLGLDDPAVVARTAWSDEDVQRLVPVLRSNRISIFGTDDFAALGRPVAERGTVVASERCGGAVTMARADPGLGPEGVSLSGTAWEGGARRLVRRVLIADGTGKVVGYGSGAVPGAERSAWRGYAVAPAGARLAAFAELPGRALCRVGEATVAEGVPGDAPPDPRR